MRMPGTPASAAYTDEAYAMTRKGHAELALGAGLVFSAVGGLFGTLVLIVAAPTLADRLGFVIASVLYLGALLAAFGVRARLVVPLAIVVTLVIHYAFYKLLRVPLPWGWLQGIAW